MSEKTGDTERVLRHQIKNDLQAILGFVRLGLLEELIEYITSIRLRYGANQQDSMADMGLWPLLSAAVRDFSEAGIDCEMKVVNWRELSSVSEGAVRDIQRLLQELLCMETPPTKINISIDGNSGCLGLEVLMVNETSHPDNRRWIEREIVLASRD